MSRTVRIVNAPALPTSCARCTASLAAGVAVQRDGSHLCLPCNASQERVALEIALRASLNVR
jgi:hypothetical protein